MKTWRRKKRYIAGILLVMTLLAVTTQTIFAIDEEAVLEVLTKNRDIFHVNTLIGTMFRSIGWVALKGLVMLAEGASQLFDQSFRLIDFTTWEPVETFINSWRPVFFALISLSILFLGLILIFWQEKKPKLAVNICLALLIVTSSAYLIDQLNGFISDDVRSAIINEGSSGGSSSELIYDMVGSSVYDLVYMDDKIEGGLMKLTTRNRVTYDDFTKQDLDLMDINEILKPDNVKDESKDLVSNRIYYKNDSLELKEIYNGVAWTDLLNEYYYRYDVEWFALLMGLISMIIVYICLAYKVVRILYEIVIQRLLAVLYSANLTNNQKTLKVLDSIKDSYITLILVMVCLKFYLLAFKKVNELGYGGIIQPFILLFLAFAVIDGPNIIQKLTGIDAGLSSGVGKMIAGAQAARMLGSLLPKRGNKDRSSHDFLTGEGNSGANGQNGQSKADLDAMSGDGAKDNNVPPEKDTEKSQQERQDQRDQSRDGFDSTNTEQAQETVLGEEMAQGSEDMENAESGFTEDRSGFDTADNEMGAMDRLGNTAEDLNGFDAVTGNSSDQGSADRMEKELSGSSDESKSGLGHAGVIESEGRLFREEWANELGTGRGGDRNRDRHEISGKQGKPFKDRSDLEAKF